MNKGDTQVNFEQNVNITGLLMTPDEITLLFSI